MKTINNFDELIESNLSLITGTHSYLKHAIYWYNENDTSNMLYKMKGRTINIIDWTQHMEEHIVKELTNKKIAYIREGYVIDNLILKYPQYKSHMAIAKERYYPTLIGYLLNRKKTMVRHKIHRMYVIN